MNKLSQWTKNFKERLNGWSKKKKIAYGAIIIGILAALIYLGISLNTTKYGVLFSSMDNNDMGAVYNKLKEKKVDCKVEGNSILVPEDQVDSLRVEVLSEVPITNGSQGFELLDKSKFGSTDAEMKINYQRALQGELERTIKSFPEVENARVHLVMPEDSVFVKDSTPATASVTLKLKPYKKLTEDQVKAMVALVSGSVRNLPKENVEINDTNGSLTKDLFNKDNLDMTGAAEKQQALKTEYEKNLENKALNMLEAVYGKDKVKVKVNADLNFDAVEKDSVTYDPKNTVVSEKNVKDTNKDAGNSASGSPVDDAMGNKIAKNPDGSVTTHEEATKNYEISKSQDKTIKAPGAVERLTVSVVLDGALDNATKTSVNNTVASAVGYKQNRGDTISVEGIPFDTTAKDNINKDLEQMKNEEAAQKRKKLYTILGIVGGLAVAALAAYLIIRKRREDEEEEEEILPKNIDTVIDDNTPVEDQTKFKPIELDVENEKTHTEKEIKKYATEKPEQVAEVVKSWLAEDER